MNLTSLLTALKTAGVTTATVKREHWDQNYVLDIDFNAPSSANIQVKYKGENSWSCDWIADVDDLLDNDWVIQSYAAPYFVNVATALNVQSPYLQMFQSGNFYAAPNNLAKNITIRMKDGRMGVTQYCHGDKAVSSPYTPTMAELLTPANSWVNVTQLVGEAMRKVHGWFRKLWTAFGRYADKHLPETN